MSTLTLETLAIIGVLLGAGGMLLGIYLAAYIPKWIKDSQYWPDFHINRNSNDILQEKYRLNELAKALGYKESCRTVPHWEKDTEAK